MRKQKVYLDTSVISHLQAPDTPDKMQDTLKLWELFKSGEYEAVLSDVTLREVYKCSEPKLTQLIDYLNQVEYSVINATEETISLAEKFVDFGVLKQKSFDDCTHIAAAIVANCDIIVSWNFILIVSNNKGNKHSKTVIAAVITSQMGKAAIPTHCHILAKQGLVCDSLVLLEQIRTIDKARLKEYIGRLDSESMSLVDKALAVSVGLK